MLKTLNMAPVYCPVGIPEKINALFQLTKSQIDTANDKYPKVFHFSTVYAFLADFVDFNVLKGQQGKDWLSSLLL